MKSEQFPNQRYRDEKKEIEEGLTDWFHSRERHTEKGDRPVGVHSIDEIKKEIAKAGLKLEDVYHWYSDAMIRRSREPLSEESFISHFFGGYSTDSPVGFGDINRGYALGFMRSGVFVPSHFAPKTLRKGYELFSSLGESKEVPAVLVITPDLVETLRKMPTWHELEVPLIGIFRGMLQEKRLMYNDHPEVMDRMKVIFEEMKEESARYGAPDQQAEAA